jgi:hypothetical protein
MEHHLWWEDGCVIYSYNCFWALPEQSLWGPSPSELRPYFTVSFETPPTWRARSPYLSPQEQGGQVIPPGTRFPFLRLSRLAGLQCGGILTHLHTGHPLWSFFLTDFKSKSHYNQRSVGQLVLVSCRFWSKWPDVTFIWVIITFFIFHVGCLL